MSQPNQPVEEEEIEGIELENVFVPELQDAIDFRGRTLVTAKLADGNGYVVLNSLADAFGISRSTLTKRLIRKYDYFSQSACKIQIATRGGPQVQICLEASAVPLFISGTSLNAVKDPESRDVLRVFITECHEVLAEHFGISERGEMRVMRDTMARLVFERESEDMDPDSQPPSKKYIDQQVTKIREEHEKKVDEIRQAFSELRGQIRTISDVDRLTPEQIGQVNSTVRSLGYLLQQRGVNNPYPKIYATLWRMAGVGTTERIAQKDFNSVMEWMEKQIKILTSAPRLSEGEGENFLQE
jgi:P22_AR N-terminal domain